MEIAPVVTTTSTNNPHVPDPDSPEPEIEAPTRIHHAKPISFSNGKCHHTHHHNHHAAAVTYRECLKNHAAGIGGHALDGCGEFMPSSSSVPSDPTSLKCAACGCHRNFHRRTEQSSSSSVAAAAVAIEFRSQNRHQLPPPLPLQPPPALRCPEDDSASPPPISSSYMLLALSGTKNSPAATSACVAAAAVPVSHKRFRTKFSQYQKERMFEFAERVGWRMPKSDDAAVREFCRQIGVDKGVFKVWMHNNKNYGNGRGGARRSSASAGGAGGDGGNEKVSEINLGGGVVATNGSCSTS